MLSQNCRGRIHTGPSCSSRLICFHFICWRIPRKSLVPTCISFALTAYSQFLLVFWRQASSFDFLENIARPVRSCSWSTPGCLIFPWGACCWCISSPTCMRTLLRRRAVFQWRNLRRQQALRTREWVRSHRTLSASCWSGCAGFGTVHDFYSSCSVLFYRSQ